jgi:hypothetical protein
LALALALALGACVRVPTQPTAPGPRGTPAGHPGFDTARYPGETALRAWFGASPYRWVGYYLASPCHRDPSWMGTLPTIQRIGWGTALLYVGQQAFESQAVDDTLPPERILCSRSLLTVEQARIDAADAVAKATAEGFPPLSVIYLDVERMQEIPPAMVIYYQAWLDAVLRQGRYRPGTYAHRVNAEALYALAQTAYLMSGSRESPPFWVSGGSGFSLDAPPHGSGFPFAEVWQGTLDAQRSYGGVTLLIDENVASRGSPSGLATNE